MYTKNKNMKTINKLIITSIVLPMVFVLVCVGLSPSIAKADTTGSITGATASCHASASSVAIGQSVTFIASASASGSSSSYTYSWSGACTGSGINCSNTFNVPGTQTAMVAISSGSATATASCSVYVSYAPPPPPPSLSVTCSANPSSIQTGQSSTFTAVPSGGVGSYVYSWSGACTGTSSNCSNTFNTAGTKTATVNVTSGNQTAHANCSVVVSQPTPNLSVTCSANPSSIQTGQSSTFTAVPSGGVGSYVYSWSGACTGTSSNCSNTFNTAGTKTATVNVTSGNQTNSATCSVSVGQSCTPNYEQRCVGNSLYWYNSCGAQGSYIGTCGNTCTPNYEQRCVGNSLYWYNSCGAQGSYIGTCGGTVANLTVTKTVRDLTTGTGFSSSTYANPSDTLMFLITLQASGNQNAQNVFVRDILPANLIYNNQLVVACSGGSNCNNNYNNSGSIAYGINLGTIYPGQTVTISYQVQVAPVTNFAYGTTTLTNSVLVTSSSSNSSSASASVVVTRAGVLGASTVSTGLTNNFWVDSFFLPLLLTLIGIWLWRSGMFFGIEKWLSGKKKVRREYVSEKELSARIANLQKSGKV